MESPHPFTHTIAISIEYCEREEQEDGREEGLGQDQEGRKLDINVSTVGKTDAQTTT